MEEGTFGEFLAAMKLELDDIIDREMPGPDFIRRYTEAEISREKVLTMAKGSLNKTMVKTAIGCGHSRRQSLQSIVTQLQGMARGKQHGNSGCKTCSKLYIQLPEFYEKCVLPANDPADAEGATIQGKEEIGLLCIDCEGIVKKRPQDVFYLKPGDSVYTVREFCNCSQLKLGDYPYLVSQIDREKYTEKEYEQLLLLPAKKNDCRIHWRCDLGHEYLAELSNRTSGSGCPNAAGQSTRLENSIHVTFNKLIVPNEPEVSRYREIIDLPGFSSTDRGEIDVLVSDGDRKIGIEVDGGFYHCDEDSFIRDKNKNVSFEATYGRPIIRVRYPPSEVEKQEYFVKLSAVDLLLESQSADITGVTADAICFFNHLLGLAETAIYPLSDDLLDRLRTVLAEKEFTERVREIVVEIVQTSRCSVKVEDSLRSEKEDPIYADMFDAAENVIGTQKVLASQILAGSDVKYRFRCLSCGAVEKISPLRIKKRKANCLKCSGFTVSKGNSFLSDLSSVDCFLFDQRNCLSHKGKAIDKTEFSRLSDDQKAACTLDVETDFSGVTAVELGALRLTSAARAYRLDGRKDGRVVIRDTTRSRKR